MMIASNPIKEFRLGLPCMLGEVVGRIVGCGDDGSWGYINGVETFSRPLFCTPHGTVIKVGVLYLSEITDEGVIKLKSYEDESMRENGEVYSGKLKDVTY